MNMGTIADHKTRTQITLEKDLKLRLEAEAKKQRRSFNNLVELLLESGMDKIENEEEIK
jgi:hypothetical protein